MTTELISKYDDAIAATIRAHSVACEKLTEKQLVEALKQALACGDFTRLVTIKGCQQVTYIPYRREQELKSRIKELEQCLSSTH